MSRLCIFVLVGVLFFVPGCQSLRVMGEKIDATMQNVDLTKLQAAQAQNAQAEAEVFSQAAQHPPRIDLPPGGLQMSNGYPNNQSTVQRSPNLPSGIGIATGRTQVGPDGALWYEIRDANGALYWANKPPF